MKQNITIIAITILFGMPLHAEYLIFKKGSPPTAITNPQEYKKIYATLMNYQWPMVIGYASQMSPDELQEISAPEEGAEENFIRKKLQTISPDYDLVYIPTLIYELFVIKYSANLNELNEAMRSNGRYNIDTLTVVRLIESPSTSLQTWYDLFRQINNLDITLRAHQKTNTAFIQLIKNFDPSSFNLKDILQRKQMAIAKRIVKTLKLSHDDLTNDNIYGSMYYLHSDNTLEAFINFEQEAQRKNAGFLYRAISQDEIYMVGRPKMGLLRKAIDVSLLEKLIPNAMNTENPITIQELEKRYKIEKEEGILTPKSISFTPWSRERPLGSVSYGNTLFAGLFNDNDACAGTLFASTTSEVGYALFIDKRSFLVGNLKSLFNYSLFNTLVGIFAAGEYFHSRTVSYTNQVVPLTRISGIAETLPFDKAGILLRIGDPLQKAYEFSNYIYKNARILKLAGANFSPSPDQTAPYYQAQQEITDLLKTMMTLEKYITVKHASIKLELQKQIDDEITTILTTEAPQALENFKNHLQNNPLMAAIAEQELIRAMLNRNVNKARILLKAGVNPNTEINGTTVLMGAAAMSNNPVLDELINAGADLNKLDPNSHDTALFFAIKFGQGSHILKLLQAGANPNIMHHSSAAWDLTDLWKKTHPSFYAKIRSLLLKYNAKPGRILLEEKMKMHNPYPVKPSLPAPTAPLTNAKLQ